MADKKIGKKLGKYLIVFFISIISAFIFIAPFYIWPNQLKTVRNILHGFESSTLSLRFQIKSWISGNNPNHNGEITKEPEGIYKSFVIAAVDDDSIDKFGSFPFDRIVWANMLDRFNAKLLEQMPKMVFFDIVFANPSQKPDSDLALSKAFSNYKGLLGEDIMPDESGKRIDITGEDEAYVQKLKTEILLKECLDYNSEEIQALKKYELNMYNKNNNLGFYAKLTTLLKEFAQPLKFIGAANIVMEDKIYHYMPMVVKVKFKVNNDTLTNIFYPSVTLAMTVRYLNAEFSNIIFKPNHIIIKDATYKGIRMDFDIPVDNKWQLAINYKSLPSSGYIKHISIKDINDVELPKDAIVFVGMYSKRGSHDIKLSPLGDMYGVEHNTYVMGTILNRDFLNDVPDYINIIYIFIFAFLIGLMVSRSIRLIGFAGATAILFPLLLGAVLFQYNYIIATFLPIISAIIVLVSIQIFMLLTEEKDKKFIKATFSSYLNPKLVDILIQNPEKINLGGVDKEVTVFFSAIKGLETITDNLDAKILIDYLNQYFSKMADIVMDTNGTLDKYIGDTVMAFWGAPLDIEKNALKACQASIKMLEILHTFNEEQAKNGYKPIQINIGINTGNIIVGNVGSEQQKNYTAIGDPVNLASRLKGLNKFFHTSIVISEFTYEKVKDWVIARELDLTKVKGKLKPVRIYELLDVSNWD